jgi:hypothetical protein
MSSDEKPPEATETPKQRQAREWRELRERGNREPDIEPGALAQPIAIWHFGQLMDGGSRRFVLRDKDGRTACLEWNNSINGEFRGRVLEYRPGEKSWAPVSDVVLTRVQAWMGQAVLRGDFHPDFADEVAHFAEFAN